MKVLNLDHLELMFLQFVDDALIMGKWSTNNAKNFCRILCRFNLASGPKINSSKSSFFGIGVTTTETTRNLASILNCQPWKLPCLYIGLPIGDNMNESCNWKPIIGKSSRVSHLGKLKHYHMVIDLPFWNCFFGCFVLISYFFLKLQSVWLIDHLEKIRQNFFASDPMERKIFPSKSCGGLGPVALMP